MAVVAEIADCLYGVNEVSKATGIEPGTINHLRRSGKIIGLSGLDHGSYRYTQETLDFLIDLNEAYLKRWPTVQELTKRLGMTDGYYTQHYREGRIRGKKSVMRKSLHINPRDLRKLLLDIRYSVSACAEKLGFANKVNLQYWNKIAPAPFFKEGIGRNKYIDPYILGRIKILHKHGVMTQEKLAHIYDSNEAFNKYIQRLFRKDHIKSLEKLDQLEDKIINWPTIRDISKRLGRNIYYFHHNYNSGKINAAVSRRDFKLHIDPKDFRKILLDLRYDYKTVARRIGIKPSRLRNLNNRLRKPFFVKSISGKNCVEPYMIKRLTIYNIEGKITNKVLSHFYDKYSKLEEYMKTISGRNITYNPDNPPYFEDCLIGAAFHYDGLEGKVIGKNYDDYTPTITVRMPKRLNTYKTLNFRVRNRSIRPPEPTKELMY